MGVLILSRNIPRYAKENCTVYSNNVQPWCDVNCLLNDGLRVKKYGTLELNYFKLDGSFNIMPNLTQDYGFWSNTLTDENGYFQEECSLTFTFSEVYSSTGLTLWFDTFNNEYCNNLTVTWYDNQGNIIDILENHIIENSNVYIEHNVENFSKITIDFNSLNKGHRYLKIFRIDFGESYVFENDLIEDYEVYEEIDLSRMSQPSNVASFIINSNNTNMFRPDMQIDIYNNNLYLGMYFSNEITKLTFSKYQVACIDYMMHYKMESMSVEQLGQLNVISPNDFIMGITANELKGEILNFELSGTILSENIPFTTPRNILYLAGINTWSIIDCSRSNKIKWYLESDTIKPISKDRIKYDTISITDSQLYNGIEYTYNETLPGDTILTSIDLDDVKKENYLNNYQFLSYQKSLNDPIVNIDIKFARRSTGTEGDSMGTVEYKGKGAGWVYWKARTISPVADRLRIYVDNPSSQTINDRKLMSITSSRKVKQITFPIISDVLSNPVELFMEKLFEYYVKDEGFSVYRFDMEIIDEKCGDKIEFDTNLEKGSLIGIIQSVTFKSAQKNIATVEVVV